jgi:hypothetical protein
MLSHRSTLILRSKKPDYESNYMYSSLIYIHRVVIYNRHNSSRAKSPSLRISWNIGIGSESRCESNQSLSPGWVGVVVTGVDFLSLLTLTLIPSPSPLSLSDLLTSSSSEINGPNTRCVGEDTSEITDFFSQERFWGRWKMNLMMMAHTRLRSRLGSSTFQLSSSRL